jgi:hypothetical protein
MNKIKAFWPYFLILFLVVLFFWKYFFKGFIPLPADFVVGVYYPWLDYNWGYLAGIPVKNPILADIPSLIYPLKIYSADLIKSGIWPLWNPLQFGGYPLLANFQTGSLNPVNLIYFIFPKIHGWSFQIILQPFLIASFTYLFLRNLSLSKISSLFGSVVFAFSGFSMIWLEYNTHGFAIAFVPLLLFFLDKWFLEKKFFWGGLFSIALALQIFSGYPQVTFYTLFLIFFYFWFKESFKINKTIFKKGALFSFWIFLGLSLSAVQIIPGWELLNISQRVGEGVSGGLEVAFLPFRQLVNLLAPDFFGNPATYNYWGLGNYTNVIGYSGLIPLFLAFFVLFKKHKNKRVISFFAVVFFISLILALPTPFAQFISDSGFLGSKAACATRILFLVNFSTAILSAFAIENIFRGKKVGDKLSFLPLIILASLFLGVFISYKMISLNVISFPEGPGKDFLLTWQANLKVTVRNLILPFLLAFSLFFLCLLSRFKFFSKLIVLLLFSLTIFELFRFGWKFTPFTDQNLIYPSTPVLEYLKNVEKPVRIHTGDTIPISMWMPYGLESSSGYDAVYPLRWAEFLSAINGGKIIHPMGRYGPIHEYDSRLFDLANNCYLMAVKRGERDIPSEIGEVGYKFRLKKLETIFEDRSVAVLKNNDCLERAFIVNDYLYETDSQKIIDILEGEEFPIKEKIILEEELLFFDRSIDKNNQEFTSELVWEEYNSNSYKILAKLNQPGFLFVSDQFYPGWKAYVNGRETLIYRANFVFRAVYLPSGEHEVIFSYEPKSFKIGLVLSTVSFIILIILFLYEKLRKSN